MIRLSFLLFLIPVFASAADPVVVGSKIFTESYILAETAAQIIETTSHTAVVRKLGLGSTGICFESLKKGAIDVYPDYTGTLAETILQNPKLKSIDEIRSALSAFGLTISGSLGFNNTYALAVKESFAQKYHLQTTSDLKSIDSRIRAAFSYEFMDRKDGYRGMIERYQFHFNPDQVREMEHTLVYQAINDDAVDVIEVYSTDANIKKYNLRVLKDDLGYFPLYQAVWVARKSFVSAHPTEWQNLLAYEDGIDESKMLSMNALADIDKKSFSDIASDFLGYRHLDAQTLSAQILQRTREHLWLVGIALLFSIFIGIPLGIAATRSQIAGQLIILMSALVQTIPALALLCFLIPLFGVGIKPALVALCLYSLLPVVVNTFTGIRNVDPKHIENAKAFGLNRIQILTRIVLPLASPIILAGVKTATIVTIGTATLAALIGAGGYGALIVSGLSLNNVSTILAGAIPAALMALVAYMIFGALAWVVIPRGLRK
jgi:osmoprotectant transport system permease protein